MPEDNIYNLGFISDQRIFDHVKETVMKYRFGISLDEFNSNLVDPIALTFNSKVYRQSIEAVLENEILRQIDKSNNNHIGYFHQNIFKYLNDKWHCPEKGYDIVNLEKQIFVEMKNKHNTMNSSSSQQTYIRMQNTILKFPAAKCYLVEVIATKSQDVVWKISLDGTPVSDERIRRVSIDKFYEIVTGDKVAFRKLCEKLSKILSDVVSSVELPMGGNTVIKELNKIDKNILKSLFLLTFKTYEGFDDFQLE